MKRLAIGLAARATGAAVAVAGLTGFIGFVAPLLIRLIGGPGDPVVLPGAARGGAALLLPADLVARTIVTTAEAPVGNITALARAPFFALLVLQTRLGRRAFASAAGHRGLARPPPWR